MTILIVILVALLWPSPVAAQERVGLLLKDRTAVAGRIEDLQGGILYIRVSQHDQRRIPIADVLMMDFQHDDPLVYFAELDNAAGPHQLLALRDGRWFKGNLLNIEGGVGSSKEDQPRVMIFAQLGGQPVPFEAGTVARVYLQDFTVNRPTTTASAPLPAAAPPVVTIPPPAGAVTIPANVRWVSVNLIVKKGEMIGFAASGRVQLSDDPSDSAGCAGSDLGRTTPGATLPTVLIGALLGRIGNGTPFGIGNQAAVPMPAAGELFLGVNDDAFNDNRGAFQVVVTRGAR